MPCGSRVRGAALGTGQKLGQRHGSASRLTSALGFGKGKGKATPSPRGAPAPADRGGGLNSSRRNLLSRMTGGGGTARKLPSAGSSNNVRV